MNDNEFNAIESATKPSAASPIKPVVSCELLTEDLMREKLRPIIEYIKEGEPDINVVLSELEEIVLRSTGEYFNTRCNAN